MLLSNKRWLYHIAIGLLVSLVVFGGSGKWAAANAVVSFPDNLPSQIIFVAGEDITATVSMYTRQKDGYWVRNLLTEGFIGRNGLGKSKEGDGKTPIGMFALKQAFGIENNPGIERDYIKVNQHYYWVDDSNSPYYNKMVRDDKVKKNWSSAEQLMKYKREYAHAIVVDYNAACIKGAGSGIFLHCSIDKATAGCISVPKPQLKAILRELSPDCIISIGYKQDIEKQIALLPLQK